MRKRIRLIALMLALCLALSGCGALQQAQRFLFGTGGVVQNGSGYDQSLKFSQMEYVRPDMEAFDAAWEQTCELGRTGTDVDRVLRGVWDFYDVYDSFYTMQALADVHYSLDLSDSYYQAEYEFCSDQSSYVEERLDSLYYALAESPIVDKLEKEYFGKGFFDDYADQADSPWTEEFSALRREESTLQARYMEAMNRVMTNGYTEDYDAYYRQVEEELAPILVELIKVRRHQAEALGYDSYEQFAWDWFYGRDFTPRQAGTMAREVAENLVPIYTELWNRDESYRFFDISAKPQDCTAYLHSAVEAMGGKPREAFLEMEARELCDLTPGDNKYSGSFEVYLTSFAAPFVLVNPEGDLSDLNTLAHEFGHFLNDYAAEGSYVSMDVAEILSQGMEYLCLCYGTESRLESLKELKLMDSLNVYVEQCAYYTFESEAYKIPEEELSVEALNDLFDKVARRFGFETFNWYSVEWAEISHYYEQPFYIISYVVSNDAALQLYAREQETAGAGLELLCQMAEAYSDDGFLRFITEYGLEDPFREGRIREAAELFRAQLSI